MFKERSIIVPQDAHIKKGALTLEGIGGTEIPLEKVDLVIMNPPFTRQERLPRNTKIPSRSGLENTRINSVDSWVMGYFILLGDRFVKKGGRMSLVFPARPLNAESAKQIREFLLANYDIEYIISSWERSAFSESTQLREILLIMKNFI